ncbi:MAG TPA: hypothetical protein VL405_07475, partial [Sphingomonas sp.]|nr:hypothetical protein [Sphingomonas sp.]
MSTNRFARPRRTARRKAEPQPDLGFEPVALRERADGWLPERQVEFVEALAECGCVAEACKRVGMSEGAAYKLRARPDAVQFRRAWRAAIAHAMDRLAEAAFSRALNGVSRPIFYKGEQVGERVYYDERLTQFLLRSNMPEVYGRWRDRVEWQGKPDAAMPTLARACANSNSKPLAAPTASRAATSWPIHHGPKIPKSMHHRLYFMYFRVQLRCANRADMPRFLATLALLLLVPAAPACAKDRSQHLAAVPLTITSGSRVARF